MASSVPPVQTIMYGLSGVTSIAGSMPASSTGPMHHPSPASSTSQSSQQKYVKEWEGNLCGKRQGQPVVITRMEGYRSREASETLAADWPSSMEIVRIISEDHMNNKRYVGKADFLVFRALKQHGFLGHLQEKKLCAVIQLPSQTLLLSVSDRADRLIGLLFPRDMIVFTSRPTTVSTTTFATATAARVASTSEAAASTSATTMLGETSMN